MPSRGWSCLRAYHAGPPGRYSWEGRCLTRDDTVATPETPEDAIRLPVVWVGAEELPVHFLNQYLAVVAHGEIFLTLGTLMPPAIMGETMAERRSQAESIGFLQVKPIVRLGFTPERLKELIEVLQQTVANYERQQEEERMQP
jgi:hypothetical protein